MALRIEANYVGKAIAGSVNIGDREIEERWVNIHQFIVDNGYTFKCLLILFSHDSYFPYQSGSGAGYRIDALLDTTKNVWETKFETAGWYSSGSDTMLYNRTSDGRLIILPIGSGITYTAGQGLAASVLPQYGATSNKRYWVNFWGDYNKV